MLYNETKAASWVDKNSRCHLSSTTLALHCSAYFEEEKKQRELYVSRIVFSPPWYNAVQHIVNTLLLYFYFLFFCL